jgi:hypothetical protein
MTDTHGFNLLAEVNVSFLDKVLVGGWQSGGNKPGSPAPQGTLPHSFDIQPNTALGPLVLDGGYVRVVEVGGQPKVKVTMAPPDAVALAVDVVGHGQIHKPQVDSLAAIDLDASVLLKKVKLAVDPANHDISLLLGDVQKADVDVTLAAAADLVHKYGAEFIADFVRAALGTNLLHRADVVLKLQGLPAWKVDEALLAVDNQTDAQRRVSVSLTPGTPDVATIRVPVELTLYRQQGGEIEKLDPEAPTLLGMVAEAALVFSAPFAESAPGSGVWVVDLASPTKPVEVRDIGPKSGAAADHYNKNQAALGAEFEPLLKNELLAFSQLVLAVNPKLTLPGKKELQDMLAELLAKEIAKQGKVLVWHPEIPNPDPAVGAALRIDDVAVRALPQALAIAINQTPGADAAAVTDFVSPRGVALALSAAGFQKIFNAVVHAKLGDLPAEIDDGDHKYKVKSLSFSLRKDALHFEGSMTIINAILGSIDVDADFEVDVGLEWRTDPPADANHPFLKAIVHDPDVDTHGSVLGWLVTALIGLFTGGALGVVVALLVDAIVLKVAEDTGSALFDDPQFQSVTAWPIQLPPLNKVESHFENPVLIAPEGVTFSGEANS